MGHNPTFVHEFLQECADLFSTAAAATRARDQIAEDQVKLAEKLAEAERALARADERENLRDEEILSLRAEVERLEQSEIRKLRLVADIREAAGVGCKPMLHELPKAIASLKQRGDALCVELDRILRSSPHLHPELHDQLAALTRSAKD